VAGEEEGVAKKGKRPRKSKAAVHAHTLRSECAYAQVFMRIRSGLRPYMPHHKRKGGGVRGCKRKRCGKSGVTTKRGAVRTGVSTPTSYTTSGTTSYTTSEPLAAPHDLLHLMYRRI
jgi:hypothetical protein